MEEEPYNLPAGMDAPIKFTACYDKKLDHEIGEKFWSYSGQWAMTQTEKRCEPIQASSAHEKLALSSKTQHFVGNDHES